MLSRGASSFVSCCSPFKQRSQNLAEEDSFATSDRQTIGSDVPIFQGIGVLFKYSYYLPNGDFGMHHTLNLLTCGYRLGTTSNYSVFRSMFSLLLWLPRLNTRLCTHRFCVIQSRPVALEKSAYLCWGVECELKVSMSLSTPLHGSQIIDLPPPKKRLYYIDINCDCSKLPMCLPMCLIV